MSHLFEEEDTINNNTEHDNNSSNRINYDEQEQQQDDDDDNAVVGEDNHEQGDEQDSVNDDDDENDDVLDMEGTNMNTQVGALLMRFCPHDSSMLYPQEDKRNRSLRYACRLCRYTEDAPNEPLVYRNERKKEIGNILHTVPSAVSDDPTLARSNQAHCSNCGHHQAVFFQSDVAQSDSLALIFVCCNCDHKWMN